MHSLWIFIKLILLTGVLEIFQKKFYFNPLSAKPLSEKLLFHRCVKLSSAIPYSRCKQVPSHTSMVRHRQLVKGEVKKRKKTRCINPCYTHSVNKITTIFLLFRMLSRVELENSLEQCMEILKIAYENSRYLKMGVFLLPMIDRLE